MTHQELKPKIWEELISAKIKRDKNIGDGKIEDMMATDTIKCFKCKKKIHIINNKQEAQMNR